MVAKAIDETSAPKVAKRGDLATQSIYHYRDGRLPSRLAIPALARCLRISRVELERLVELDGADRQKAGAA